MFPFRTPHSPLCPAFSIKKKADGTPAEAERTPPVHQKFCFVRSGASFFRGSLFPSDVQKFSSPQDGTPQLRLKRLLQRCMHARRASLRRRPEFFQETFGGTALPAGRLRIDFSGRRTRRHVFPATGHAGRKRTGTCGTEKIRAGIRGFKHAEASPAGECGQAAAEPSLRPCPGEGQIIFSRRRKRRSVR